MAEIKVYAFYDELIQYFKTIASPEEILAFQVSDTVLQRAAYLTERNKAGELTPQEAAELDQLMEFDQLMGALKLRARRELAE